MELVEPSMAYVKSLEEAIGESNGEHVHGLVLEHGYKTAAAAIEEILRHSKGEYLPDGWVPASSYFLVENNTYIGIVNIRHYLNAALEKRGGHIGYSIRTSKQRQGYGTHMLGLALQKAKVLGIDRVLITCDADNIGSRKVIEKNGGVLQDEIEVEGAPILRFWIENN